MKIIRRLSAGLGGEAREELPCGIASVGSGQVGIGRGVAPRGLQSGCAVIPAPCSRAEIFLKKKKAVSNNVFIDFFFDFTPAVINLL